MGKTFQLISPKDNTVTLVSLNAAQGGGVLALNGGTKKIKAKGSAYDGLGVATQKELQQVYDNGPAYASMISPPDGHAAPWQEPDAADQTDHSEQE